MTLVFLHGAGFLNDTFAAQTQAFSGALAPDLPGHRRDGAPESVEEFAEFAEDFIRERGLRDAVLCGHSMGAAIALETALRGKVELRAIVLLGGGARMRVAPQFFEHLEADFEAGARELAGYYFAGSPPGLVEWAVASMRKVGKAQTIRDFRACDAFDVLGRLRELRVPLFALTGEHDRMTPPKYAQTFADRVAGAQARIVPGAGHFAMVERPEETNEALRAFLRQPFAAT